MYLFYSVCILLCIQFLVNLFDEFLFEHLVFIDLLSIFLSIYLMK